ncbi:hypothetical protein ACVMFA_006562 [Bradyrhizobium liaoningense]
MPRYSAQPELTKGSKLTAKDVAELRSRRRSSVSLTLPWRGKGGSANAALLSSASTNEGLEADGEGRRGVEGAGGGVAYGEIDA